MAYAIPLAHRCDRDRCKRDAAYVVKNNRNGEVGRYCQQHADALVTSLSEQEDRERRAEPSKP